MDSQFPRLVFSPHSASILTDQGSLKPLVLFQSLSCKSPSILPSHYLKTVSEEQKKHQHILLQNYLYSEAEDTFYHVESALNKECSMFVDQELVKEQQILGVYKCDPLFIILPYLNKQTDKKMAWSQIIIDMSEEAQMILRSSKAIKSALQSACGVREGRFGMTQAMGSFFYSLQLEKLLELLKPKVQKLQKEVRREKAQFQGEVEDEITDYDLLCEKLPQNLGEEACTYFSKGKITYASLFEQKKEEEKCYTEETKMEEELRDLPSKSANKKPTTKKNVHKVQPREGGIERYFKK